MATESPELKLNSSNSNSSNWIPPTEQRSLPVAGNSRSGGSSTRKERSIRTDTQFNAIEAGMRFSGAGKRAEILRLSPYQFHPSRRHPDIKDKYRKLVGEEYSEWSFLFQWVNCITTNTTVFHETFPSRMAKCPFSCGLSSILKLVFRQKKLHFFHLGLSGSKSLDGNFPGSARSE